MKGYTTYGKFQSELNNYYKRTGNKLQFVEMMNRMDQKGLLEPNPIAVRISDDATGLTDEEFDKLVDTYGTEITDSTYLDYQKLLDSIQRDAGNMNTKSDYDLYDYVWW